MTAMSTNSLAWMPFALALVSIPAPARAVQEPPAAPPAAPPPAPIDEPRGLIANEPGAFDGLTIIEPLRSKEVHLVDMTGKIVHTWKCAYPPGAWTSRCCTARPRAPHSTRRRPRSPTS